MMNSEVLALSIVVLVFSIVIHEVMHGVIALRFGDRTAQRAGRLTLNPIPHIDLVGSILLPGLAIISMIQGVNPGFIVGWAKPVPVNPLNFSDIKKGEFFVSLAGILANLGLAVIARIIFAFTSTQTALNLISEVLLFTITINLILAVFNLIPIPPLDGSKVLMALLPYNLAREYQKLEPFGFIILLSLWFIPFGGTSLLGFILYNGTNLLKLLLGM